MHPTKDNDGQKMIVKLLASSSYSILENILRPFIFFSKFSLKDLRIASRSSAQGPTSVQLQKQNKSMRL